MWFVVYFFSWLEQASALCICCCCGEEMSFQVSLVVVLPFCSAPSTSLFPRGKVTSSVCPESPCPGRERVLSERSTGFVVIFHTFIPRVVADLLCGFDLNPCLFPTILLQVRLANHHGWNPNSFSFFGLHLCSTASGNLHWNLSFIFRYCIFYFPSSCRIVDREQTKN